MNRIKIITKIFVLFTSISACSTQNKEQLGGGLFNSVDDNIVIIKAGSQYSTISPYSRQKWLDIQKSEKNELKKIQGLLALGKSLEAERKVRKYLAANPNQPEAILTLASSLAQSRQYDLAAYYASIIENHPKLSSHALNIIGLSRVANARSVREYKLAEQTFVKAINSNKKEIAAGLNLGQLYLEIGNSNAAVSTFRTTSIRCAKCQPALLGYGISSLRLSKFKNAEDALKDIIDRDTDDIPALYYLALVYQFGLKNNKKAETTLAKIADSDRPGYTDLRQRAQALMRKIKGEKQSTDDKFANKEIGGDARTEEVLTGESK
ncbi:MAG: hypothetical protein R3B45_03210 [Bdellovibrionota bacterium]